MISDDTPYPFSAGGTVAPGGEGSRFKSSKPGDKRVLRDLKGKINTRNVSKRSKYYAALDKNNFEVQKRVK